MLSLLKTVEKNLKKGENRLKRDAKFRNIVFVWEQKTIKILSAKRNFFLHAVA